MSPRGAMKLHPEGEWVMGPNLFVDNRMRRCKTDVHNVFTVFTPRIVLIGTPAHICQPYGNRLLFKSI